MAIPIFQVDAFTAQRFAGNPAAVCVLDKNELAKRDDGWMQNVAAEMNLSETAFLSPHEDPFKRAWRLRWFTPATEVDLCGHATLATAHILLTEGYMRPNETAIFHTRSGELRCTRDESGWITMDFPRQTVEETTAPAGLLEALGTEAAFVGYDGSDYLVEVGSAATVRGLRPDFVGLGRVEARGVIVTAAGDDEKYDFVSRFFGPAVGINEDPVTGSAHCSLTPYWAAKLGKEEMVGYQASPRGGVVRVKLAGERVLLQGQAVTVLKGQLA